MAQDGSEASVTSTSSTPNWWDLSSWNPMASWQQHPHNPNSGSCDEDMSVSATSFTNATPNHSGLTADDSPMPVENQLWSHLLLGVGGTADGGSSQGNHEASGHQNFLQAISSKNTSTGMFEPPVCDYSKKLEGAGSWELSGWSIAPPQREMQTQMELLNPMPSPSYIASPRLIAPSYEEVPGASPAQFLRPLDLGDHGVGYQSGGFKYGGGGITDLISFEGSMNKAMVVANRQWGRGHDIETSLARGNTKGNEGKRKRCEDNSENALTKKVKQEASNPSSVKLQLPKVKIGDKIGALQQIVCPFGKTDTASVLMETINYIRFLHEQVQLLSDPYMKSGGSKEHASWGGPERKEMAEKKADLSSRGLCLVPVSCTPQVCRENGGPDYWTPTYRGCLYR